MKFKCQKVLLAVLCMAPFSFGLAQDKVPSGHFAVVNGEPLPDAWLDQDKALNPEARRMLKAELAARAALSQEAKRQGLDKSPAFQTQLRLVQQKMLVDALLADLAARQPITDVDIQADYERQKKLLKDAKEYRVRDIVLSDEATAKSVIARLSKGESFDKLAREMSIEPSGKEGGDLGWLLAEQIIPAVANVMVNLAKGAVSQAPIQTPTGWHVIRLDDTRPFVMPSLTDAKERIRQGLLLKQRNELINKQLESAKISMSD